MHQDMPLESRDLFAGRILNTNSIASRRIHMDDSNDKVVVQMEKVGNEQEVALFQGNNNNNNNENNDRRNRDHYHQYHIATNLATVIEEGEEERIPDAWSSTEEIRSITPFTESVEAGSIIYESLELSSTAVGPIADMTSASADFPFPMMPMNIDPSTFSDSNQLRGGRRVNTSTRYTMAEVVDKHGPSPTPPSTPRSSTTPGTTSTSIDRNNVTNPPQLQPDSHCVNSTAVKILPTTSTQGRTFITSILNCKTSQHFLPLHHPQTATRKTHPNSSKNQDTVVINGRGYKKPQQQEHTIDFHPIAI